MAVGQNAVVRVTILGRRREATLPQAMLNEAVGQWTRWATGIGRIGSVGQGP
jgi:hypothetical protein